MLTTFVDDHAVGLNPILLPFWGSCHVNVSRSRSFCCVACARRVRSIQASPTEIQRAPSTRRPPWTFIRHFSRIYETVYPGAALHAAHPPDPACLLDQTPQHPSRVDMRAWGAWRNNSVQKPPRLRRSWGIAEPLVHPWRANYGCQPSRLDAIRGAAAGPVLHQGRESTLPES